MYFKKIAIYVLAFFGIAIPIVIALGLLFQYIEDKNFEKEIWKEFEEIEFTAPISFEKSGRYLAYSHVAPDSSCRLDISATEIYMEDFEKWFKSLIVTNLNDEVGKFTKKNINGNEFLYVEVFSGNKTEHHYAIRSTNYYYLIEYDYYDKDKMNPGDICLVTEDEVISSIKVK